MKAQKIGNSYIAAVLFISLALQGCGGPSQGLNTPSPSQALQSGTLENESLFVDAPTAVEQAAASDDPNDTPLRARSVLVNFDALKRAMQRTRDAATTPGAPLGALHVNLFDDDAVDVTLEEIQDVSAENMIATGRVVGQENSAVTLVMNEGTLVANVRRTDRDDAYVVQPLVDGIHAVRVTKAENSDDCLTVDPSSEETEGEEPIIDEASGGDSIAAIPLIDILVAYTPNARARQGGTAGIKALIQMGIADTNRAMADSGANVRVRLVGTMEVYRNESSNYSADLSALRGTSDGKWDEVHRERTRLGADQVTLVGAYNNGSNVQGIGYLKSTASTAFTVVKATAFKYYTFSHELGHNIGLNHSDGYVSTAGRFRTIMAYGSYPRLRRYSNPSKPYNGLRTGTSLHNSVSIINRNASRTAALKASRVATAEVGPANTEAAPLILQDETRDR